MAEFKVSVVRVGIQPHPNADALEFAVVGGYRAIVRKGQYQDGDLAVYIPEQAVLPDWLIRELGLTGKLAGKNADRVKAIRLRGELSQGLVYPLQGDGVTRFLHTPLGDYAVREDYDVRELLGIVKWEPPIPTHMSGQVWNASGLTVKFDVENWKMYPDVIQKGEQVIFTEKAHGTFGAFGIQDHTYIVYSKGLGAKGLAFKINPQNSTNLYVRTFSEVGQALVDELTHILDTAEIFVFGEIFGPGVQDLHYGRDKATFRVFDIYLGSPTDGRYLNVQEVRDALAQFKDALYGSDDGVGRHIDYDGYAVEYMPVLYEGPFSEAVMNEHTNGQETISGYGMHVREGIVIRLAEERRDPNLGRVMLKSVSADYLTRKGGTEYN